MESVKWINIPVVADSVLMPDFFYGNHTGIYFVTSDDEHGRITFENLDAVKICRGEIMPYPFDYSEAGEYAWVFQIENSAWQQERFHYENKHYGKAYEFGGNVEEMLTDFKHYLFSFHDQFIEVIARGFWFEKAKDSLFGQALTKGHPFLPLPAEPSESITVQSLQCQIRKNTKSHEQLVHDAQFCSQKLFEFVFEDEGRETIHHRVLLSYRKGELISTLRGYFGRQELTFDAIAELDQILPFIQTYIEGVYERRKNQNRKKEASQ